MTFPPTARTAARAAIVGYLVSLPNVVADPSSYAYSPSPLVKFVHSKPHLDSSFNVVNSTFALSIEGSSSPQNDPYLESITTLPATIGGVCFLFILGFIVSLLGRCCCKSCSCAPDESEAGNTKEELLQWTAKYVKRREKYKSCYIYAFILVLLAVNIMHYGNVLLTDAAQGTSDGLTFFRDSFQMLSNEGVNLYDYGTTVEEGLMLADDDGCYDYSLVKPYMDSYFQAVSDYQSVVDPIPPEMDDLNDTLELYGITYKNLSIYVLYGVVMFVLLIYIIAYCMKVRAVMGCASVLSCAVVVAILLLCVVEMILVMLSSDFCMDPRINTLSLAPSGAVYDNLNYYSTCEGTNPSEDYIDDALYYVDLLNSTVYALTSTTCSGNEALIALYPTIDDMYVSIDSINSTLACPPIQEQWLGVLYDDICDTGFTGLYSMWVCQYGVFATLFCLLVAGSIIHNFFGAFWDVQLSMLDENESKRKRVVDNVYNSFEDGGAYLGSHEFTNPAFNASSNSFDLYNQNSASADALYSSEGRQGERFDDADSDTGSQQEGKGPREDVPIMKRKKLTPEEARERDRAADERAARVRRGLPV